MATYYTCDQEFTATTGEPPWGRPHPTTHAMNGALIDANAPLTRGHVHTTWARLYRGAEQTHRNQINVGVDRCDITPVHQDTLVNPLDRSAVP